MYCNFIHTYMLFILLFKLRAGYKTITQKPTFKVALTDMPLLERRIFVYFWTMWSFDHIWYCRDLDLWPIDLKIKSVHLCPQLYLSCKPGEIPGSGL